MPTVIRRAPRAALPLLVLLCTWTASAHEIVYFGRATAVSGEVTTLTATEKVLLADVGMSCTGAPREEMLLDASNPSPLSVHASEVSARTQGIDGVAATESGIQQLLLEVPGLQITAEQIQSFAEARCNSDESIDVSGGSTLSNLAINGEGVAISGEPNQTIEVPNLATIIINEQVRYSQEFRVVGLHVKVADPSQPINGDIRLAAARAKIKTCDM